MRDWLKKVREDANLTQNEVALKSDISRQYYAMIETGERGCPVCTAKKIAAALGFDWQRFYEDGADSDCTVDELLKE